MARREPTKHLLVRYRDAFADWEHTGCGIYAKAPERLNVRTVTAEDHADESKPDEVITCRGCLRGSFYRTAMARIQQRRKEEARGVPD